MTPLTKRYFAIAKRHGLSCPLGRALYLVNRHYNDGFNSVAHSYKYKNPTPLFFLRRAREDTAVRWLRHWQNGGCLKMLKLSEVEYREYRAAYRQDLKERNDTAIRFQ